MRHSKRSSAVRQQTINIRVTAWEKAMIKRRADRLNLSVSAYLVGLALGFEHVCGKYDAR